MAGYGGARPGAGRPPGAQNRVDRELREQAAAEGITPLEYMLRVMRDPKAKAPRRDHMAVSAAPYIHAKLANVQHQGSGNDAPIEYLVRWLVARETLALPKLEAPEATPATPQTDKPTDE
jgi:hypothetical protein